MNTHSANNQIQNNYANSYNVIYIKNHWMVVIFFFTLVFLTNSKRPNYFCDANLKKKREKTREQSFQMSDYPHTHTHKMFPISSGKTNKVYARNHEYL